MLFFACSRDCPEPLHSLDARSATDPAESAYFFFDSKENPKSLSGKQKIYSAPTLNNRLRAERSHGQSGYIKSLLAKKSSQNILESCSTSLAKKKTLTPMDNGCARMYTDGAMGAHGGWQLDWDEGMVLAMV